MNQQRLQDKRRKRQAKRKDAQARARRRTVVEAQNKERMIEKLRQMNSAAIRPGPLGRLLGGTQVTPDQMDAEAAPIVGGGR